MTASRVSQTPQVPQLTNYRGFQVDEDTTRHKFAVSGIIVEGEKGAVRGFVTIVVEAIGSNAML